MRLFHTVLKELFAISKRLPCKMGDAVGIDFSTSCLVKEEETSLQCIHYVMHPNFLKCVEICCVNNADARGR